MPATRRVNEALGARLSTRSECSFRVTSVALCNTRLFVNFRYAPFATEVLWRCNMSRRAISGQLRQQRTSQLVGSCTGRSGWRPPSSPADEGTTSLLRLGAREGSEV